MEGLDPFIFFVYLATSPEKTAVALDGIKEELLRVREQGATAQEIERAKRYLVGNYEIEIQKNSALAAMLAFDERYGLGCHEMESYTENIMGRELRSLWSLAFGLRSLSRSLTRTVNGAKT